MKNATRQDIERACQIVYEGYTGKCWHEWSGQIAEGDKRDDCVCYCNKCSKRVDSYGDNENPKLASSLDAWDCIWYAMGHYQHIQFDKEFQSLRGWACVEGSQALALVILEAALRASGKYDEWAAE